MIKVQEERILILTFTLTLVLSFSHSVQAKVVKGLIEKIGDATHLEFQGKSDWKYEIKKVAPNKMTLTVPAFDVKTEAELRLWKGRLIKAVKVSKEGPNGQYIVSFDLANDNVESFDYLTDDPSRLIVDFYTVVKPQETVAKSLPEKAVVPLPNKGMWGYKKKGTGPSKKRKRTVTKQGYQKLVGKRRPAGSELITIADDLKKFNKNPLKGVFDGGDPSYSRFLIKDYEIKEESIIASRQNIYLRFPRVKLKTSKLKEIKDNPPEYKITPKDNKENKEARFLLTLFRNKRYAAFIKTINYFQKKYPHSVYDELLRNMLADVHYERWKKSKSTIDKQRLTSSLRYLVEKYPESVMTERSDLILAYIDLENKDGVSTVQRFLRFIEKYPESTSLDQAHKALADGYLYINKYKAALDVLKELEKNSREKDAGVEATYRLGDIHFQEGSYKKSVSSYKRAIEKFPLYESKFANANYNMAEAYFWLGDFKKALSHYVRFVELFPSHQHGSYALTRIGEVLDILGADKSKVMGAYLECSYRFRKSEGSEVARVRMLSQKMKNMREKELKKGLEEMNAIADNSKLPRMEEFVSLMVADGLHRRGEYEKGLDYLITYYQRNPTSTDVSFFRKRILKNIGDLIKAQADSKNFMEVLNINSQYSTTWLNNLERYDIPYFVGRAYEMAGVYDEALSIYKKTLDSLNKIKGTREEKERRVTEHLPYAEEVLLRLAQTAYQKRQYINAGRYLEKIKSDKNLSDQDQVEKVELLALVAEQKGQINTAKKYLKQLIEAWEGRAELLTPTFIHLASIEYASRNYRKSEDYIAEVERLKAADVNLNDDLWFKTLELKAKVLEAKKQTIAAIETYSQILDEFESKRPVASMRFRLGKLMFESGNMRGAEKIWNGIDPEKHPMFVKLAKEKLSNAKWEDDYKKYINRIPAAEKLNRSSE